MYASLAELARVNALQALSMRVMFTLLIRTYASTAALAQTLALQELSFPANNSDIYSLPKEKSATCHRLRFSFLYPFEGYIFKLKTRS